MLLHQQILSTDALQAPAVIAPPSWTLTGNGIILLYRFPEKFIRKNGFLADYQQDSYKGLVGSVMLVDYHTTPVGPYQEILFIPGLFRLMDQYTFSISKIYVSSHDSVWNGIENWGIPKEHCSFDLQTCDNRTDYFSASLHKKPFFEATIQRGGFSFPLTTTLFPLRITQRLRDDLVLTKPSAKGKAYLGQLKNIRINAELFPDFSDLKPLSVLVVKDFQMVFPTAKFQPIQPV